MTPTDILNHWQACAQAMQGNETHWLHLCALAAQEKPVPAETLAPLMKRTCRSVWDQLEALVDIGLVERVPGTGTSITGRRYGKAHWCVTPAGLLLLQRAERRPN